MNSYYRFTDKDGGDFEFETERGPSSDPMLVARIVAADILSEDLGEYIDPEDIEQYGYLIEV